LPQVGIVPNSKGMLQAQQSYGETNLKKISHFLAAIGGAAVTFALVSLHGCGNSSGAALANVNGETITMDDFHEYLEAKPTVRVQTGNGTAELRVAESLAFQALQDMIARQVTLQLAKDEGAYPSEQDIMKELEFQKKLNPGLLAQATRSGITIERIKEALLLNLARENLLTKDVDVPMAEAEEYIRNNPQAFMDPATADMLWVFVKSEDAKKKVDAALASGQTFSAVADQYSEFPGAAEQRGRFPQRIVAQMQPDLRKMVEATSEGKATGWLKLSDGHAKFFVEKKAAEKPLEMTPERKELVRRQIAQQRGGQARDLGKRVLEKLVASKVEVKERSLVEAWERAFERFKQEQKVEVPTASSAEKGGE
jgi:parvulin-like peptidyl-prolyl isomerase